MNWTCEGNRPGTRSKPNDYYGHTLERASRELAGLYHGWFCRWCRKRFAMPGHTSEVLPGQTPLEWVEAEDEPEGLELAEDGG